VTAIVSIGSLICDRDCEPRLPRLETARLYLRMCEAPCTIRVANTPNLTSLRLAVELVATHIFSPRPRAVVVERAVGYTRGLGVHACTAELLLRDFFIGHGLGNVQTGHEHVRRIESRDMKIKSAITSEYMAPPAHGPMAMVSCGTTPEASTLSWSIELEDVSVAKRAMPHPS
jgi:hypothetical protein